VFIVWNGLSFLLAPCRASADDVRTVKGNNSVLGENYQIFRNPCGLINVGYLDPSGTPFGGFIPTIFKRPLDEKILTHRAIDVAKKRFS